MLLSKHWFWMMCYYGISLQFTRTFHAPRTRFTKPWCKKLRANSRNIGLQARVLAFKHQGSQNRCIFAKKTNLNAKSCKLALWTLVWKPGYLISSTRVHKRNAFSQINQSRMQNLYAKNCWLPLRTLDLEGSVLAFKHQGSQNSCIFSNKTTRRNEAEMQNPDAKSC